MCTISACSPFGLYGVHCNLKQLNAHIISEEQNIRTSSRWYLRVCPSGMVVYAPDSFKASSMLLPEHSCKKMLHLRTWPFHFDVEPISVAPLLHALLGLGKCSYPCKWTVALHWPTDPFVKEATWLRCICMLVCKRSQLILESPKSSHCGVVGLLTSWT